MAQGYGSLYYIILLCVYRLLLLEKVCGFLQPPSVTSPDRCCSLQQISPPLLTGFAAKDDGDAVFIDRLRKDRNFLQRNKQWVILVDDEASIRQSVGDFLFEVGFQVTACADMAACQEVMTMNAQEKSRLPSCIVSDIRMPPQGANAGLELLQWIRTTPPFQRLPVILLTAKGMTSDRIQGYKTGADAYLPKPFLPDELIAVMDNSIARRQQQQQDGSLASLQQDLAAIKELLSGELQRQPVGEQVIANTSFQPTDVYLTPVERHVLELLGQGLTNGQIAAARKRSTAGVSAILQSMYGKTGTQNRTELVRWALQTGYIDPQQQPPSSSSTE